VKNKEDLPQGWTLARVSDLATVSSGKFLKRTEYRPERSPEHRFPVAGAGGQIGWARASNADPPVITLGRVGACGALNRYLEPSWVTDNALLVGPFVSMCGDWLCRFFETVRWTDLHTGSSQPLITQTLVRELELPVPPLAEQKRIVERVEALLAQVQSARDRLERVQKILKRFRQAVLESASAGRLESATSGSNPEPGLAEGWKTVHVEEVLRPGGIFDGPFGSNLKSSDYTSDGARVIRLENLANFEFVRHKQTFVSLEKFETLTKHSVQGGDVIFGSFVDGSTRVCVLPELPTPAIAKADCFCLRPEPGRMLPGFLALQLSTNRTRDALIEEIHGATRPRITTRQLRALEIPICGIEEQQRILAAVARHLRALEAIHGRVTQALRGTLTAPQAILSRAFAGDLVPTEAELARVEGRGYESGEELLARVRAEGALRASGGRRAQVVGRKLRPVGGP
jgi:type I restriction enzyme, S subunit